MKRALPVLVLVSCGTVSAQIENGGFEVLNDDQLPAYWQGNLALWQMWVDPIGGMHGDSVVFDQANYLLNTTDVHSGQHAIELRNGYNYTQDIPYVGTWSASSESSAYGGFPLVMIGVEQRPVAVTFYAKYLPLAGDAAYANVVVYDEATEPIGQGEWSITGPVTAWTAFELPITYTSTAPAAFYSLSFATAAPGAPSTIGTRLLIDDVTMAQATGIAERAEGPAVVFYPNPAHDRFHVQADAVVQSIHIADIAGHEQAVVRQTDGTVDCATLADGIYVVRTLTAQGESRRTLLVQH